MTRRVLAFMLALTIAGGTQQSLMYAAAAAAADRIVTDPAVQGLVATAAVLPAQPAVGPLAEAMTDSAIQCQRGAHDCFGHFSYNCCAEIAALMAIAGAVGAWLAAGVGAYYYWYYC